MDLQTYLNLLVITIIIAINFEQVINRNFQNLNLAKDFIADFIPLGLNYQNLTLDLMTTLILITDFKKELKIQGEDCIDNQCLLLVELYLLF